MYITKAVNIPQHSKKRPHVTKEIKKEKEKKLTKNKLVFLPLGTTIKLGFPRFRYIGMSLLRPLDPVISNKSVYDGRFVKVEA